MPTGSGAGQKSHLRIFISQPKQTQTTYSTVTQIPLCQKGGSRAALAGDTECALAPGQRNFVTIAAGLLLSAWQITIQGFGFLGTQLRNDGAYFLNFSDLEQNPEKKSNFDPSHH